MLRCYSGTRAWDAWCGCRSHMSCPDSCGPHPAAGLFTGIECCPKSAREQARNLPESNHACLPTLTGLLVIASADAPRLSGAAGTTLTRVLVCGLPAEKCGKTCCASANDVCYTKNGQQACCPSCELPAMPIAKGDALFIGQSHLTSSWLPSAEYHAGTMVRWCQLGTHATCNVNSMHPGPCVQHDGTRSAKSAALLVSNCAGRVVTARSGAACVRLGPAAIASCAAWKGMHARLGPQETSCTPPSLCLS